LRLRTALAVGEQQAGPTRTITIDRPVRMAITNEPGAMAGKFAGGRSGLEPCSNLFAARLVRYDALRNPTPQLVENVPALDAGTWRLLDDGRMETVYRLRNATWYDGTPLGPRSGARRFVAGQLREAGVDTTIFLLPSSAPAVDDKAKGTFPALTLNNNTLNGRDLGMDKWLSSKIGSPENEWIGTNRLGWSNPEYDRLYSLFTTTLDLGQATQHMVQMMKLLSAELHHLPLYYNFQIVAHGFGAGRPEGTLARIDALRQHRGVDAAVAR